MNDHLCPFPAREAWQKSACDRFGTTHGLSLMQNPSSTTGPVTRGWLVGMSGVHQGEDFRLTDGDVVLGSAWTSGIVLTSPDISRQHACVRVTLGKIEIEDLNSSAGVFVNREKKEKAELLDGDIVGLGHAEFIFHTALPPKSGKPVVRELHSLKLDAGKPHMQIRAWLLVSNGEHAGQDFRLIEGENRLGNSVGLEVTVLDTGCAPVHCIIECKPSGISVRREKSAPTMVLNGQALDIAPLHEGDLLLVGNTEFFVRCP